jgi:hypothetical protein
VDAPLLYIVSINPEPAVEADYQRWYDEEHVPELMACPGFRSAGRYRAEEGSPRYLACYEVADLTAFESPEYRALSARRLDERTELTRRVLGHSTVDIKAKYRRIAYATGLNA